ADRRPRRRRLRADLHPRRPRLCLARPESERPMTAPTINLLTPVITGRVKPGRARRANRVLFLLGASWIALLVLAALFADVIPGLPHYSEKIGGFAQGPDFSSLGAILGTDGVGRSNLARIIYGARISLTIAVCSTLIGLAIGLLVGLLAG